MAALAVSGLGALNSAGQPGGGGMPVVVTPIVEREIPATVRLVGTVTADRSAVVASEVGGIIARFESDRGTYLRSGQTICVLDSAVAELKLAEAQAQLGSVRARLAELENGTREEELRRWEASQAEAQALYDKWDFERKRIAKLYEGGQSNEKERHDTEMEYLAASRRLAAIKAQLDEARNGPRPEAIARARHDVAAAQALVSRLARDVEKTTVAAPFDGFVVEKRTEVGEWIEAGGAVCEFVALDRVRVRADVPEAAIAHARVGSEATVEVEALGRIVAGAVSRVIPRAAPTARTFPVEIDVANADHALLPGMFVWAHVSAGPSSKRLMVSKDALVTRGGVRQIFVVREGAGGMQMATPIAVETGLERAGEIEIRTGEAAAGDLVVIRANERLYGPTPVAFLPAASQPAGVAGAGGGVGSRGS